MTSAPLQIRGPSIKVLSFRGLLIAVLSLCAGVATGLALAFYVDSRFDHWAAAEAFSDVTKLPVTRAALVPSSTYVGSGADPYSRFEYRLDAAAELWKAGKVRYLIVSGNAGPNYSEPDAMKRGLMARGVPAEAISLDNAGPKLRDSILRTRDFFDQYEVVIVAQPDVVGRALYFAHHIGMEAWGYKARDVDHPDDSANELGRHLSALYAYVDFWLRLRPRQVRTPMIQLGKDAGP